MKEGLATARATTVALYEAYNRHLSDTAAALYAADGRHEEVAQGQTRESREAIAEGLRRFFEAFPDARWEEREVVDGDKIVAVTYVLTGTLRSALGPISAREQRLELQGVHVLWSSDGLLERTADYWDMSTFLRQMNAGVSRG